MSDHRNFIKCLVNTGRPVVLPSYHLHIAFFLADVLQTKYGYSKVPQNGSIGQYLCVQGKMVVSFSQNMVYRSQPESSLQTTFRKGADFNFYHIKSEPTILKPEILRWTETKHFEIAITKFKSHQYIAKAINIVIKTKSSLAFLFSNLTSNKHAFQLLSP